MTFLPASNIGEAIGNTVVGLGTVFVILIFLIFVISMFKYVNKFAMAQENAAKAAAKAAAPAAPKAVVPAAPAAPVGPGTMASANVDFADEVEGPIAAVILAAVAQTCGGNFKVTSIKKSK